MEGLKVEVVPIYAEDCKVNAAIKMNVGRDEKGKEVIRKEGRVELLFFDNATKTVSARIVIDSITAGQLAQILLNNKKAIEKELQSKEIPDAVRKQIELQQGKNVTGISHRYIG